MATKAGQIQVDLQVGFDKNAMNNAVNGVARGMNDLASRTQEAVRRTTGQSAAAFAGIGAALTASFAFGARAAAQFEDEFANVKKTLDVTGTAAEVEEKFENIARELRNISKFSPATVTELNQIAAVGGQLGIAADEIVKFTDTIQKLTVATNLSAEQAALSLARLQKITGLTSNDIDNLGSVIVKLGNNFATTESEIITAATQIATATAGTSTPFNNAAVDALAFATALRAIGQPAQAGSTAIIRLIQVVDRAVSTGGGRLQTLADTAGLTVEGFKDLANVDPNRAVALFIEGLGQFEKEGGDAVAILESLGLGQIRSRRAIQALSRAIQEQGGQEVPLLTAALDMANQEFIENTALLTEAERRYDTVVSQIQILRNTVNEAGIAFGSQFLPQLNAIVAGAINITSAFSDLNRVTKILGTFGLAIVVAGQAVRGSITAFKMLTMDLLEYQAAVNLAATGNMNLEASQQRLLFTSSQFRSGGLITDFRFSPRQGLANMMDDPLGMRRSMFPEQFGQSTKAFRIFTPEIKEAVKLSNRLGLSLRDLANPAALLADDMQGLKMRINEYNLTAPRTIELTKSAQAGMIGLSLSVKSVAAAFTGLLKGAAKIIRFLVIFKVITDFFEKMGAASRGVEQFSTGAQGLIESIQELDQAQADLISLKNVRDIEKAGGADDKTVKAIETRIEQIEQSILSKQNGIEDATAELLSGLFPDLEKQINRTAITLGKAPEQFTKDFFGGMTSLITDFENGALPTVEDVIEAAIGSKAVGEYSGLFQQINDELGFQEFASEYFKETDDFVDTVLGGVIGDSGSLISKIFGNKKTLVADQKNVEEGVKATVGTIDMSGENMEKAIKKMQKDGGMLETLLGEDVSLEDAKEIAALTELVVDTITSATGLKSEDFLKGITDFDALNSQLVKGRQELLMAQQRQLAAAGLLANKDIIDVTESVEKFDQAQEMVTDIIEEKFSAANSDIESVREELGLTNDELVNIAATIDQNLESTINNALNLFQKMPDKIIGSFEGFALDLLKKMDVTQVFETMVRDLAQDAPLLANEFAKQGPASINQLEQALQNMPVTLAVEARLEESVGDSIKEAVDNAREAGDIKSEGEAFGTDIADGVVDQLEARKDDIGRVFRDVIDNMFQEGDDEAGNRSPSLRARKLINNVVDGMIIEFDGSDAKLFNAAKKAVSSAFAGAESAVTDFQSSGASAVLSPIIEFANVFSSAVSKSSGDFGVYTAYQNALRDFEVAEKGVIEAEQGLNAVLRDRASFSERMARATKELNIAEIEGRKGNIVVSEEISLLRQKLSIQQKVDALEGKRSAKDLLAIQRAEENIQDLRAMNEKGVISNLELQAAEEELAELRGDNVTEDEKKLAILELTQAEKDYNSFLEKALDTDERVITARENVIRLQDEEATSGYTLIEAQNNLDRAQEGVAESALAVEEARANYAKAIAADGEYLTNIGNLIEKFGLSSKGLDDIDMSHGKLATTFQTPLTATFMDPVIEAYKEVIRLQKESLLLTGMYAATLGPNAMHGTGEYNAFMGALESGATGGRKDKTIGEMYADYFSNFTMPEIPSTADFIQYMNAFNYGMGGRIKKYKYGGRGDPMTRALVGEYGPEEVRFIPGNGFMVKPLGTGKSGTVVNNLNVNVTGVPSDPISARKAAVQISKALRKLDKEGSSGTGLRRN